MARTVVDRVVGFFSPQSELQRIRARMVRDILLQTRRYEGASRGRRTENWLAAGKGPNTSASASTVGILRDRARDLDRNNSWATGLFDLVADYTAGPGIIPQAKSRSGNKTAQEAAEKAWLDWGETTAIDVNGRLNFYGMQHKVMRCVARDGEVLALRVHKEGKRSSWRQGAASLPIKVRLLESDYIDSAKNDSLKGGGKIISGVEVDANGTAVAYWLYKSHPTDGIPTESHRIPAEDVLHVFREDRLGQRRGVTWAAPVIIRLKDLDDFQDARLQQAKIAACFAAFIENIEPNPDEEDNSNIAESLAPGLIMELPPTKTVKTASPPAMQGESDFVSGHLRGIARGTGLTYEMVSGDLSKVNFSSGRMGQLPLKRRITHIQEHLLIPQFCNPVYEWFLQACSIAGTKGLNDVYPEWTLPRWEYLDPVKEATGTAIQVKSGEKSLAQVIKETGRDPYEHLDEIAEFNKEIEKRGLRFETDVRDGPERAESSGPDSKPDLDYDDDDEEDADDAA